ncbi:MAG: hypothetical protein VX265_02785, partial [Myxococcota bacterium]|nr:hypothetical protein [Myxococcota bacterium]
MIRTGTFLLALLLQHGCARSECAQPAFDRAECRVAAEAELATITTADGVRAWFAEPAGSPDEAIAAGLMDPSPDGGVDVRLGGLGGFRLVFESDEATTLPVRLENVDPRIDPLPGELERDGLVRQLAVSLAEGRTELVGALPDAVC